MSINVIKFDWDLCKQVDEILAKHNVQCYYTKFIQILDKKYKGNMYNFQANYGDYEYVKFSKFKNLAYAKKVVNIPTDFAVLKITDGFITDICMPPKLKEIKDFQDIQWDWKPVNSLEDLDNKLTEMEITYKEVIEFYKKPEVKKLLKTLAEFNQKEEAIKQLREETKTKIQKQLNKIINITNDF
ncbi:MAG: hypothetical protein J6V44_17615 [Methanobrevibacter sp.]|nr:hypothetical protein [Methanobrevibacter sp.]